LDKKLVIYTDGCSKGNPGPAGIGFAAYQDNGLHPLFVWSGQIGVTTNNQAEYQALIAALKYAVDIKATEVEARSDSLLIVNQMNGSFRVKKEELKPLYTEARSLSALIKNFSIRHIPREQNRQADALANQAMKGPL
jgi:ribonuclease HI